MDLYNSIFMRKSIRMFKQSPLSDEQLSSIVKFASGTKPLLPGIRTEFSIVGAEEIKGMLAAKAPHYVLLFSEEKEGHVFNAGFLLQQMDLFLSASGLGSCWLGMAKPKTTTIPGLSFQAMLAIGTPDEPLYRTDISEFKRKSITEISKGDDSRLEAGRLAPSATNGQPWYFICNDEDVQVYRKKQGGLKGIFYDRLTQLDLGITLCHLMIASEHGKVPFTFRYCDDMPDLESYSKVGLVSGKH